MNRFNFKFLLLLFFTGGWITCVTAQNTCASPITITSIPFNSGLQTTCGTGNDYNASDLCDINYGNGQDFVYQLEITTAPVTYLFVLGGSAESKIVSVHSACPPAAYNCVDGITTGTGRINYREITFNTNGIYFIIIDTWPSPACGDFSLNILAQPGIIPNDICSNALILPSGADCIPVVGSTNGATDNNETGDCEIGNENAVWYQFQATNSVHFVIVQGVPGFNPVISAVDGCGSTARPTGGTCTDNTGDADIEKMYLTGLTVGDIYYVQVHDYEGDAMPSSLFTICIAEPAVNDACSNAFDMGSAPTSIYGSNLTATDEGTIAKASCDQGTEPINDVWYQFTTNMAGGTATITFNNNSFDGVVAVYYGCNTSDEIYCADDFTLVLPEIISLTNLSPNTVYYIRVSGFNGESGTFSLTITGAALPVELLDFSGVAGEKINILNWTTATEKNVVRYIVERSPNGTDSWKEIGETPGRGDAQSDQNYALVDQYPLSKGFYRLRSTDRDAYSDISRTIVIVRPSGNTGLIEVFPNPTTNLITVHFQTPEESAVEIQVADISGRILIRQSALTEKGMNYIPVHLEQFSTGQYILSVISGQIGTIPVRFVKK